MSGAPLAWLEHPSGADYDRVLNFQGWSRGGARIQCTVSSQRRPRDCEVLTEQIPGDGRRATKIAERYRAAPKDEAGQPSIGRKVCFDFDFNAASGS